MNQKYAPKTVTIKRIEIEGSTHMLALHSDPTCDWYRKRTSSGPVNSWGPSLYVKGCGNDAVIAKVLELRPHLEKLGLL